MSSELAIRVDGVGKCFHVFDGPYARLAQLLGFGRSPKYREYWALRDVSLEIRKGETVGIIGCNGAGKSTLLQIICGTMSPTQGSVQVHGRLAALLELGAGFNPEFTGRENAYLNAAILGLSRAETDAVFPRIEEFADIGEFIDQPVRSYSSGMFVRLAFAVQACIDPDVLVVDEALAVGDERFQRKCFARMEALKQRGTAIILVSHVAQHIIDWCDTAHVLHGGELIYSGIPLNAIQAYQKLIYTPPSQQQEVLESIRSFRLADARERVETSDPIPETGGSEEPATQAQAAWFDPSLAPESTVIYESQGAEITDILIRDLSGRTVNVLQRGQRYQFVSRGRFLKPCRAVHFGIHIRLGSGHGITGQRHPGTGLSIAEVGSDTEFEVVFDFKLDLLPGAYFVGGGIWSDHEPECLHRVLDRTMFRVLPVEHDVSFGYFDASGGPATLALRPATDHRTDHERSHASA